MYMFGTQTPLTTLMNLRNKSSPSILVIEKQKTSMKYNHPIKIQLYKLIILEIGIITRE